MYELETKTCTLELKVEGAIDGYPDGFVSGYASTFEKPKDHDFRGDIFAPGAFDETLKNSGPEADDPTIVMLYEHYEPFGVPEEMHTDKRGLMTKGVPSSTAENKDRMTYVRDRVIRGLSIGYYAREWNMLDDLTPWGEKIREITLADIAEYSITRTPGNINAHITDVKSVEAWMRREDGMWVPDPTNRTFAAVKTTETLAGKVLSAKSRGLVVSAMDALEGLKAPLQALLDASDEKKSAPAPSDITDGTDGHEVSTETVDVLTDGDTHEEQLTALSGLLASAQLLQLNVDLNSMT